MHENGIEIGIPHSIESNGLFGPMDEHVRLHEEQTAWLLREREKSERGFWGEGKGLSGKTAEENAGKTLDAEKVFHRGWFGERKLGGEPVVKCEVQGRTVCEFEGELGEFSREKKLLQNRVFSPQVSIRLCAHGSGQLGTLGRVPELFELEVAVLGEKCRLLDGE